ncbi:MacB family efflux pump subunit [Sinimarinibacterium sp. CAU 1509]|uniref:MacB family efflux pump subunit n=1 Tax=Sinimarinibacterium sp. CAU 1509 TaxID=2562283 RepID=UPI0010ABB555|nr:MacB family efflux pump subunit [Sinimarinibacterium sp. CAU 1509]TJY62016.1 MacB family efflux pump subunit [Sinimarinibacterium sp. CAU 1509]
MTATPSAHDQPLISLRNVSKVYPNGETEVRALDHVNLEIRAGEFVSIIGQSGSGKSTLMNIIGCLDRPSHGHYCVRGADVAQLAPDDLAAMRRDTFGFVFQRYNLLASVSAAENVELPAIYAGRGKRERLERAKQLLAQLGLGDRSEHKPNQLSGGQQQRVSIARALMNGAEVILADEPTGALDSRSGAEVLELLSALHAEGHTIILITHDPAVAAHARRTIQLKDGQVIEDTGSVAAGVDAVYHAPGGARHPHWLPDLAEAVKMALRSLRANLFRSALTLLGVVIGVAAVVTMLAIGNGSKQDILQRIQAMGSNLLLVRPGAPGQRPSGDLATLVPEDATAVVDLDNVAYVSPERRSSATLRYGSVDYRTTVYGVWPGYQHTQDWKLATGSFINQDDVDGYAAVTVLGKTVAGNLFPDGSNPVGRYVLVGNVPFEVIGVLQPKGANAFGSDMDDVALVPLSTGFIRLFGKRYLSSLNVKIESAAQADTTQAAIERLLLQRHGTEDFQVRSTTSLMETVESTQNTLTVMLGAVAAISLLVGGIGVMNIMLVNVTERTREIGLRMATGARRSSILLQFNTEALVVCGIGGVAGVALGFASGAVIKAFGTSVAFTALPAVLAFSSAFATGLIFGYLPARKAAHMDPVVALSSE